MAAALSDIRAGPASWIVCCGGIWQWSGSSGGAILAPGATGMVSFLSCMFLFAPKAIEMLLQVCNICRTCDQEPIAEDFTVDTCVTCAGCLAHLVAPRLGSSIVGAGVAPGSTSAVPLQVAGF